MPGSTANGASRGDSRKRTHLTCQDVAAAAVAPRPARHALPRPRTGYSGRDLHDLEDPQHPAQRLGRTPQELVAASERAEVLGAHRELA